MKTIILAPVAVNDDRYNSREGWRLVDKERLMELKPGDDAKTEDGRRVVIEYLQPPHKPSSQGKVTVRMKGTDVRSTWYASVIGCEYQYKGDAS